MKIFSLQIHMGLMGLGKTINIEVAMIPIGLDVPQKAALAGTA